MMGSTLPFPSPSSPPPPFRYTTYPAVRPSRNGCSPRTRWDLPKIHNRLDICRNSAVAELQPVPLGEWNERLPGARSCKGSSPLPPRSTVHYGDRGARQARFKIKTTLAFGETGQVWPRRRLVESALVSQAPPKLVQCHVDS